MLNFLLETFSLGLKNLRLHKLRSLLTALGIIFGVAAVIIMVAIGEGTKQAALEQLRQLGAKNIILRSVPPPESSDNSQRQQSILEYGLKRVDLQRLHTLPGLVHIVPLRNTEQPVIRNNIRAAANAIGTTPDAFDVINLHLERGRYFTSVDYERGAAVCVIGTQVSRQLFPYEDPLGRMVTVGSSVGGSVVLEVIGVLEPTGLRADGGGGMVNHDLDQDVYFPLTLSHRVFGDAFVRRQSGSFERKNIELSEIWLQASTVDEVEHLAALAKNIVEQNHPQPDYEVKAPIQILRSAEKVQDQFNYIMVGIASFALVVGGIGIMNIMLANVTERTREIGIRRALGAKRKHITLQFLIETTVISLTGGLIGIGIGVGGSKLLSAIVLYVSGTARPTDVTSWSVIGSFVISGLIGIGFGLYPAVMAARMNPIEALRHE
jgi:putative ABC transport system permease protein